MKSSSMPVFNKLNLGEHAEIVVLNAPKSFEPELARLKNIKVLRDPKKPKALAFGLAFAMTQAELDRVSTILAGAAVAGDAVLWFAYPKGTSKRYRWNSIATPAGGSFARPVSNPFGWWRSTRTGRRCASGVYSSSSGAVDGKRTAKREAQILKKLAKICLNLPETQRRDSGDHADFRVRARCSHTF